MSGAAADAFARLEQTMAAQKGKPPLDQWDPPISGDIDIEIRSDGQWYHEGSRFKRHALVKLFASILRREADGEYYLVTPVEKWRIRVVDFPLRVVDFEVTDAPEQRILMRVNTDETVPLDKDHRLNMVDTDNSDTPLPVVDLWQGLTALIERSVWYRLIELGEQKDGRLILQSYGNAFDLGGVA